MEQIDTVFLGGIVHLSTIDYPGNAATTIFLSGCNVKCKGCHNKQLWERKNETKIDEIIENINWNMISAVTISGGEPLEQEEAIIKLAKIIRKKGKKVGLHTSGKGNLLKVIEYFDFILISKPEEMEWNR
jgi:pyruvate formate lyase activating enzyme